MDTNKTNQHVKLIKIISSVLLFLFISGCTNSKLIISPLYNRLDNQMRDEFHKLAKWDDSQIEHFESRVGTFHVWHRQEELPKYAALLNRIQSSIKVKGDTSQEEMNDWVDSVEAFSQIARTCHPANFSYDLMQTLTDDQVNFIERRFANERRKNYAKYTASTPEERRTKRVNNVVKWAGRIGFDFTSVQKSMLEKTMAQQISMRRQYYVLVDQWAKDLFKIARQQEASNYEQDMQIQVDKLWTLLEEKHNEDWKANRVLWREFGYDFVQTLSGDQRIYASSWIDKMGNTLQSISEDKPSYKVENNPAHGCLVGQSATG